MNPEPSSPNPGPLDAPAGASYERAAEEKTVGLHREILDLLRTNKKFWMIPIVILLVLFGVLLILGATSAAPFIYTFF
jgi:uncharacterized integral membrane protein